MPTILRTVPKEGDTQVVVVVDLICKHSWYALCTRRDLINILKLGLVYAAGLKHLSILLNPILEPASGTNINILDSPKMNCRLLTRVSLFCVIEAVLPS